ncbi:C1 family peptidase [Deinococcus sp. UYEF24]
MERPEQQVEGHQREICLMLGLFKLFAPDGAERVIKGYKPSKPKAGTKQFSKLGANISRLPHKVDLRPQMTNVEDQGNTNSCAANATAGAYEYLLKRHQGELKDVSRLYIYYNARHKADPDTIEDEGATLSDVIDSLKEYGACTEPSWIFDEDSVNEMPSDDAYEEGASFVVEEARQVPLDLETWKTALAAGNPIIFGIMLYDSFDKQRKPGLVPAPTKSELSRESHSGHAMLCVGYSDPDQVFIVRNSWGSKWGDKGYCYMSYDYVMDSDHNFDDSWIIERVEELPADAEAWSDDEESVLEEVSTALAEMDEETYASLLETMGDFPFELRMALLFLAAVSADGEISDEEIAVVSQYLESVLEQTGGNQNAAGILKHVRKELKNQELIDESIEVIWQCFDYDVLASMTNQMEEAASADGFSKAERRFLDDLTSRWQAGADEEDVDEEDEEDADDEDTDEE